MMNAIHEIMTKLPINDLNLYEEMGNAAIRNGDMEECMKWYMKGLAKARELKNSEKAKKFSHLLVTLL